MPLRLLVPAANPLANQSAVSVQQAVDSLVKNGLPLVLLEEARSSRPLYPSFQALNSDLRYEYVSAHAVGHGMCAAGSVACLSTLLLLTDQQRRAIRAVDLKFATHDIVELHGDNLGMLTFRVDCPGLRGSRLQAEKDVIEELMVIFVKRMREQAAEGFQGVESVQVRTMFHKSFDPVSNAMKWVRGTIRWYNPTNETIRGLFQYDDHSFRFDGNIAEGQVPDGKQHLVLKGVQEDEHFEEFVASFIGSKVNLAGIAAKEPLVGLWLGRRRRPKKADVELLQHSLGYAMIMPERWNEENVEASYLDNKVQQVRKELLAEIEGLQEELVGHLPRLWP